MMEKSTFKSILTSFFSAVQHERGPRNSSLRRQICTMDKMQSIHCMNISNCNDGENSNSADASPQAAEKFSPVSTYHNYPQQNLLQPMMINVKNTMVQRQNIVTTANTIIPRVTGSSPPALWNPMIKTTPNESNQPNNIFHHLAANLLQILTTKSQQVLSDCGPSIPETQTIHMFNTNANNQQTSGSSSQTSFLSNTTTEENKWEATWARAVEFAKIYIPDLFKASPTKEQETEHGMHPPVVDSRHLNSSPKQKLTIGSLDNRTAMRTSSNSGNDRVTGYLSESSCHQPQLKLENQTLYTSPFDRSSVNSSNPVNFNIRVPQTIAVAKPLYPDKQKTNGHLGFNANAGSLNLITVSSVINLVVVVVP